MLFFFFFLFLAHSHKRRGCDSEGGHLAVCCWVKTWKVAGLCGLLPLSLLIGPSAFKKDEASQDLPVPRGGKCLFCRSEVSECAKGE